MKHARVSKSGVTRLTMSVVQNFATLLIVAGSMFAAILDTGCTATVAGADFVRRYVSEIRRMCSEGVTSGVDILSWVNYGVSNLEFTTGSGKVRAKRLVTLPIFHGEWCTLDLHEVPGSLPLLISLGTMRQMGIVMDLPNFQIRFRDVWYRIIEHDGLIIMPILPQGWRKALIEVERRQDDSEFSRRVLSDVERRSDVYVHNSSDAELRRVLSDVERRSDLYDSSRKALIDVERREDGSELSRKALIEVERRTGNAPSAVVLRTVGANPGVIEASEEKPNQLQPQSQLERSAGVRGDEQVPALTETEIQRLQNLNLDDKQALVKLHRQFGHRRAIRILQVLKAAGFSDLQLSDVQKKLCEIEQACAVCQAEKRPGNQPKISLPHALFPNHIMLADLTETNDGRVWLHLLDQFSTKSAVGLCKNKTPEVFISIFTIRWVSWTGFPKIFYADIEGGFGSAKFVGF